jgi:hypothetical protein
MISCKGRSKKEEKEELAVSKDGFPPFQIQAQPGVEEYATMEAITNGVPVWSFSNLCYIYGAGPDLMPGLVMQEGNQHPLEKIKLKKSWEIKYNGCGGSSEMTCHSAANDSQPMLPIHLIDGDPGTVWSSWGLLVPDGRPEWIRIDLPMESEVASVSLVCAENYPSPAYGKSLPKELEVKTSRDAWHWETVYASKQVADQPVVEIKFKPRLAKQIWIIGQNFRKAGPIDAAYVFSIASAEVRDPSGNNLALVSRGASVMVSSVNYLELNNRFTQDALWAPLNFDLGNKWLRFGGDNGSFMWPWVEHEKGKLELDPRASYSLTDCARHGVNTVACLDMKGNWIYANPPRKTNWPEARFREMNDAYNDRLSFGFRPDGSLLAADANPEMYQAYLRYVEYMVRQLKGRVTYLEMGNEWNAWFGAEHYMTTFFEPMYKIVKQVWPEAKVMLGSPGQGCPGELYRNSILDCLGRETQYGLRSGKLLLNAEDAILPGAVALREDVQAQDVTVSAETENKGQSGIILRYKELNSYLVGLYAAPEHSIMFYEVGDGEELWRPHWNDSVAKKKVPNFGESVKLEAKVQGSLAKLTISGGGQSASTTCALQRIKDPGRVGLVHQSGETPQLFWNFLVIDAQGKTLVKDEFSGTEGTVPAGWKYYNGGANPIKPGLGARLDAIAWHPGADPDAAYFTWVRKFQKKCRDLGFTGPFFATEVYTGAMYPPGPISHPCLISEIAMAKFLMRSVVGHNGVGMVAQYCHPHFTGRVHPQALCQGTWGAPTLVPCRPTMAYYVWRNMATLMDDFHPSEFAVNFSEGKGLLHFTFQRGDNERLVTVWIDAPVKDGLVETRTDVIFPGVQAQHATVADIMNGTEQELDVGGNGGDTVLKGMRIKDYPVFVTIRA